MQAKRQPTTRSAGDTSMRTSRSVAGSDRSTTTGSGDTGLMRHIKVTDDGSRGSRFEDVEIPQTETPYAENTPALLLSPPILATALAFVTLPPDVRETGWHPPPRRQFVVILDGEFELETTDGQRRRFQPGATLLVEDLAGRGHVTRVRSDGPATFMAIPLSQA